MISKSSETGAVNDNILTLYPNASKSEGMETECKYLFTDNLGCLQSKLLGGMKASFKADFRFEKVKLVEMR